ncbi:MAG: ParB/RepB/Spo0J family partition protein [Bacteroidota bacterium]
MNAKKTGLGRGLSALLESSEAVDFRKSQQIAEHIENSDFSFISIEKIEANPYQPRTEFEQEALEELSESIKVMGIIQPITVRNIGKNKYQLISGERRFRASKLAGLKTVPAFIRKTNDDEMLQLALVENIQRENLNSIEVAISYERLINECNFNQEELSAKVGKQRSTIVNYLRLLKLPPEIQLGLKLNKISMGHARSLINIQDQEKQNEIFEQIIEQDLSVRKAEELVRNIDKPKKTITKISLHDKQVEIKNKLTENLKTKVDLKISANGKGTLLISFKSDEHLKSMLQSLKWD